LKQTWTEKLKPILVVNKIDRLVTELKLAPIEAHHHLVRLVEQVNAVLGSFYADERLEAQEKWEAKRAAQIEKAQAAKEALANSVDAQMEDETTDEDIYFAPELGNVIFCSAVHGWAFRVDQFASFHAARLGIQASKLQRVLWGDFYYDPKTKRVVSRKRLPPGKTNLKPLFVQLVLENLWAVYNCTLVNQ
jgi:ribosome assembly protein 1